VAVKFFITLAINWLIKLFFFFTDAAGKQAGPFVPGQPIQPSLMFACKAKSLHLREISDTSFPKMLSQEQTF
jgi:hypothetical protein